MSNPMETEIENLERRLADGRRLIEERRAAGINVDALEEFWCDLSAQYERLVKASADTLTGPVQHRQATCSGCGKNIIWRFTENGARMPLDPDPVPAAPGTYVLEGEHNCRQSQPMFDAPETEHHMNHWTTCSHADQFKKRG